MRDLSIATWRKSTFSDAGGTCVEFAPLADGTIAVRDSKHPDADTLVFTCTEMATWINGCKANEFSALT